MRNPFSVLALCGLAATALPAQSISLLTTLVAGNGQNGNMFDITNISTNPVTILTFDQNFLTTATASMEIYRVTGGGTFVGSETTPANWTLVGSTTNLSHPGSGTAIPIPILVNVTIPAGATQGFYVTCQTGDNVAYTNATSLVGTVFVADSNIQFKIGVGKLYPFAATFAPRIWNGRINYVLGGIPPPFFQVNSLAASLDFGGVQGGVYLKAVTTGCPNTFVTTNLGGTAGQAFEIAYNLAATVASTSPFSYTTAGGQVLNLDLSAGLTWLFGGLQASLRPFPGNFTTSFNPGGSPGRLSGQLICTDPTHPDGFRLSQGSQLDITALSLPSMPIPGPALDDSEIWFDVGCVAFFGRSFTRIYVESNGRIMFGNGNTSYLPATTQFATDPPSFGVWTDFSPNAGGTITVNSPGPGIIVVNYAGVRYYGTTISNTFDLWFDTNTRIASIINLSGLAAGGPAAMIGISGGNAVGATDPGAVNFGPAPQSGSTPNATDMIYMSGNAGAFPTGVNRIDFLPNALNNFNWITF